MFTSQEKAECVSWFIKTKSDFQTQRNYTTKYAKEAPARQLIGNWHKQLMETGTVLYKSRRGKPSTSEEDIERFGHSFSRSPRKSILGSYSSLPFQFPLTACASCQSTDVLELLLHI